MGLYNEWRELAEQERTQQQSDAYWQAYFEKETEAYRKILTENTGKLVGTAAELAERFQMTLQEIAGFLDGINTSLTEQVELETLEAETAVERAIDFEKLYYNMLGAKAPWLYGLDEWDGVLSNEKRHEITKAFRTDGIYHNPTQVGRNDPCPCGSGKKYKQCCGRN